MTQQSHRQGASQPRQPLRRQSGARRRALLALVGAWMLLLALAVGAQQMALASPPDASQTAPLAGTPTDTPIGGIPSPTPTKTPKPTPTSTIGVTPSPTSPGSSPTPTDTPTSPPTGGGGNGGGNGNGVGGGGPGGPDATKVALAQPTIGIDNGSGGGITPSSLGSEGMLIATGLSCITALLGIIIAVVALMTLLQGGYGPFLRALLLGKRAAVGAAGKGGKNAGKNVTGKAAQRGAPIGDGTLRWQNGASSGMPSANGRRDDYDDWDGAYDGRSRRSAYDDDGWDAPRRGSGGSRAGSGRAEPAYPPRGNGGSRNSSPGRSSRSRSRQDDW